VLSTISAAFFLIGGAALVGYGSGKVTAVTKQYAQTISAIGAFGLISNLLIDSFIDVTATIQAVIVSILAILGAVLVYRGNETIGNASLGAVAGFSVAVIAAQFLGIVLNDIAIKCVYLIGISALAGWWVQSRPKEAKWGLISAIIAGSFALTYGLDRFIFKSNWSNMGNVILTGRPVNNFFSQQTTISSVIFVAIIGIALYLNKAKL
jgi:preprotein translocase subunit SecG